MRADPIEELLTKRTGQSWVQVDAGVWVGRQNDEHVGFVERIPDGRFVAFDAHSQPIGRFATLAAAKASTSTVISNPHGVRRRHRARRALFLGATATGAVATSMALTAGILAPAM